MRIDIANLNNASLDPAQFAAKRAQNSQTQSQTGKADSSELRTQFDAVIQQAMNQDSKRQQMVLQAKNELDQGTLDTPQAARDAALNILNLGI